MKLAKLMQPGLCMSGLLSMAMPAAARPAFEPAEYTVEPVEADLPFASGRAAKAAQDTVWIADWSFDAGGGACTDAGWVKYDNHIRNHGENYWVADNRFAGQGGVVGKAAILTKHDLCWPCDGYGNDWDFSIVLKYAGTDATLTFTKRGDSEPGFDFVTVEADSLGLSEARADLCLDPIRSPSSFRVVLATSDGYDPGSLVGPLTLPDFGPGVHEAYIRFRSDGGFSAEDCLYPSAIPAGLVVDQVIVTGALSYTEDFEGTLHANVTLANTANATSFCAAPWTRLFSHITDNDKCTENTTCAWLNSDPLRIAMFPSMAFGPGQAVVHSWLDDVLVSPWVSLASTPTATATLLSFRRFGGNSFATGKIVQGWRVRSRVWIDNTDTSTTGDVVECTSPWGHGSSFNSLSSFVWTTSLSDMTAFFNPTAPEIQVSFRVKDWQGVVPDIPPVTMIVGPGPYTDRVRIGRRILPGPALNMGIDARTQAQDAFPTVQNSATPGEHFSPDGSNRFGTCALSQANDIAKSASPIVITGDSILLESAVDARGANGIAAVRVYGAIVAGPHAGKAPAPYSVGANGFFEVNADSARNSSGAVVANRWFADLDDTYFRGGDVLYYAWIVTDNGGGMASLPPGITTPPVSVAAAELATDGLFEVSFLPQIGWAPGYLARIAADAHGDLEPSPAERATSVQLNCILYNQKLTAARRSGPTQRTSFMYTLDRMGYRGLYDVYDPQGYGSTNNQLGGRANVGQASGYAVIIQDDGRSALVPNVPAGTDPTEAKVDQAQWYRSYLAQGIFGIAGQATLWILGENTAFASAAQPLFSTDMGLGGVVGDQALAVSPDVAGVDQFTWASGSPSSFVGDGFVLQGGCPAQRAYDAASAGGTAVVTHRYRSGATSGGGAVILNKNTARGWNTVWMGFGWADIRDPSGMGPAFPEVTLAGKILSGVLPPACAPPTPGPCGPNEDCVQLPRMSALHPNVPNPFNPTTQIGFDLATDGRARLRIFDAGGRLVRTLLDGPRSAGRHAVAWSGAGDHGRRLPSGIYFYRLEAAGFVQTRKMVLLK